MLRLRPYKPSDAETILKWIKDEDAFRKWSTDRYPHYPITADDMNHKYMDCNGDCAEPDNFYPMTAFDDSGIVGHLIMRFTDAEKFTLFALQKVQETLLGITLLTANFRRKIADFVEETDEYTEGAGHRPARLFRKKTASQP